MNIKVRLSGFSWFSLNFKEMYFFQELMNWHRPRVEALLKAGVDILALETIPAQVQNTYKNFNLYVLF